LNEVVPKQESVPVKKPGKTHMREGTQSWHKASVFSLDFKIHQIPQL